MVKLQNELLSKYTTVKIGGIARTMLVPESEKELLQIIREYSPKYFIGGGSNLLINDKKFDIVVNLRSFDTSIENIGEGSYRVGASARLQKLISQINDDGYGGIEYLYNVPGLVGGAVAMNAGTGNKENKAISDFIVSVDVISNKEAKCLSKEQCYFSYRDSYFKKNPNVIITSIVFKFPSMTKEVSCRAREAKMQYYKEHQDPSFPNFGSVFRVKDNKIMRLVKKLKLGGRVHFSGKTANWILNEGGNYHDAIKTIKKVELLHKLLRKKCVREVIVWE